MGEMQVYIQPGILHSTRHF